MKKKILIFIILVIFIIISFAFLYLFNFIPHRKYTNKDFGIEDYISKTDKDGDGIDDQTDILENVRKYIATKPKYKSKYYNTGYPNDEYGVCTDVVGFGLLGAGYNLQELVNADIVEHQSQYNIEKIDKNKINILMAHQFVTSGTINPETSESETINIGGIDNVDASNFSEFDYDEEMNKAVNVHKISVSEENDETKSE